MIKKTLILFSIISLLGGCAAPKTARQEISDVLAAEESNKQKSLAMRAFLDADVRLHNISYPLLLASVFICEEEYKTYVAGYKYRGLYSFSEEWHEVAISEYGLGEAAQVTNIVLDSPAGKAGLQKDDIIVSFDGKNLPLYKKDDNRINEMWKDSAEDGRVTVGVLRDEENIEIVMDLIKSCNYPVIYLDGNEINAYADGDNVYINKGLMRFSNDNELAAVIAHEISHNAMKHIEAKKQNASGGLIFDVLIAGTTGIDPNIRGAAANAYSQEFEAEADYVSLYIMARAGLEIEDVPNLWRRMGAENPGAIEKNILGSHPSSPERFVALENAVKEIKEKIANNEELVPNMKEDS